MIKKDIPSWEKRFKDNKDVLVWNGIPDSIRESKLLCFIDLELWLQKESIFKEIQARLDTELERYRNSTDETHETYLYHKGTINGLQFALNILNFRDIKLIECEKHGSSIADSYGKCKLCESVDTETIL